MGRAPCCDENLGLKKGPWTPDEDHKLVSHIRQYGHGSWRALPAKAGLKRCGKSCRLRWTNYLRPDIKRGRFSFEEERLIIQLHAILGNRWSAIASHLPRRTDNEIKNYWNTHVKKRLTQMGIDPITHQKSIAGPAGAADMFPALNITTNSQWTPMLTQMTQWDLARAKTQARLSSGPSSMSTPTHPSALFMTTSWKTKLATKVRPPVKQEPGHDVFPFLQNNSGVTADNVALGEEISDRVYSWSGDVVFPMSSVFGEFQSQSTSSMAESPTSILHGPDSDAITSSPCGSSTVTSTSDCLDLMILQQSGGADYGNFPSFPALSGSCSGGVLQRHQAAASYMAEPCSAKEPDVSVLGCISQDIGCLEFDLVPSLDFNGAAFPSFEILCQGDHQQYVDADCGRLEY